MRLSFLVAIILSFAACKTSTDTEVGPNAGADLIPVKPTNFSGPRGWCKRVPGGLLVRVKNQGILGVGKSGVRVVFHYRDGDRTSPSPSEKPVPVPALAAAQSADVIVPIPSPVPAGDFTFTIHVDSEGTTAESPKTNNTAEGQCID